MAHIKSIITRGVIFAIIWWVLTDGAASSWVIGVPAVLLTLVISFTFTPPLEFRWLALLRFTFYFLWRSMLGGVDVGRRVFRKQLPIAPALFDYSLQLPPGPPRALMANVVSLLPGTLSAEIKQNVLKIHVLDHRGDFETELKEVEKGIANMFAVSISEPGRGAQHEKI